MTAVTERLNGADRPVSTLEIFFDLVFVLLVGILPALILLAGLIRPAATTPLSE
jgi:low temperature requirement protein LtrA